MTWLQAVPVFLLAVVVFAGPGLVILGAAGVRRLNLVALAVPVSITVSSVTAVIAPPLGLSFTPLLYAVMSVLAAILAFGVRFFFARHARDIGDGSKVALLASNGKIPRGGMGRLSALVAVPAGLAFGGGIIASRLVKGFSSPENFSQTFDNVFHLNAIHYIATTANGSSLTLGNLTEASRGFYPAAMHDTMALVEQLSGAATPVVINMSIIFLAAVVWPLGCMFLAARIVGYRPLPILIAGVLSAGFSASPYLLIGFGVLYSLFTAVILLPVALGLVVETLRLSARRGSSVLAPAVVLLAVLPGLALAHPSAIVALMAFTMVLVIARLFRSWLGFRRGSRSRGSLLFWVIATPIYAAVFAVVWKVVRPDLASAPWGATQTTSGAIGEVAASSPLGAITAWVYLFATIIGLMVILRWQRSRWWVAALYLVGGTLYVFAAGWGLGSLRTFMVGVWYNDPFRLAALLPVVTLPVVVIGVEWLLITLRRALKRSVLTLSGTKSALLTSNKWTARVGSLLVWVAVGVLGTLTQSGALSNAQERIESVFAIDNTSLLLTVDERDVLNAVSELVPQDGTIMVNPFTGASLAFALENRMVLPPHMFGTRSVDEQLLIDHWDQAAYAAGVCDAIREKNAFWALDFGTQTVIRTDITYLGLADVTANTAPDIEVLYKSGDARLVRITACD